MDLLRPTAVMYFTLLQVTYLHIVPCVFLAYRSTTESVAASEDRRARLLIYSRTVPLLRGSWGDQAAQVR